MEIFFFLGGAFWFWFLPAPPKKKPPNQSLIDIIGANTNNFHHMRGPPKESLIFSPFFGASRRES